MIKITRQQYDAAKKMFLMLLPQNGNAIPREDVFEAAINALEIELPRPEVCVGDPIIVRIPSQHASGYEDILAEADSGSSDALNARWPTDAPTADRPNARRGMIAFGLQRVDKSKGQRYGWIGA